MAGMIGIDWGTSSFRAYLLDKKGTIQQKVHSDDGILSVKNGDFSTTMQRLISQLGDFNRDIPIVLSGMITSKNGWLETPYIDCPAAPPELAAGLISLENEVYGKKWFVPGVKQLSPEADIMRGEEVQLAGLDLPGDIVVLLPGTHSKWVKMKDGIITEFKTFMTGDIYTAALQNTILKTAIQDDWSSEMFVAGVHRGYKRFREGSTILSGLFQVRVQAILELAPEKGSKSFLSGMLIGSEIAESHSSGYESNTPVQIVGENTLATLYLTALDECKISGKVQPPDVAAHGLYRIAVSKRLL